MSTANERLLDEAIHHAIDLSQYSVGVTRRIISLLNKVDPDLFAQLAAALERLEPTTFTVERLDALLNSVRLLNASAYMQLERELTGELRRFVEQEGAYQLELFNRVIPPQVVMQVGIAPISLEQTYAAAMARPFQGVLLRQVLADLGDQRATLLRNQIRIGFVEQEPISKIVQRIRGTRVNGYADGLWEAPRRHVEAVVRTSVSHTAAVVRERFYEANSDLVKAQTWTATLDQRTSSLCRLRDGLKYTNEEHPKPIGHKVPWGQGPGALHWNCRSTSCPVLVSAESLGLPELGAGTRASMDGQVPSETSYLDWLKKQPASRQDEILGATRGALLRKGGLEPRDMYDMRGRWLTLDELAERNKAAFQRAGVSP